MRISVMEFGRFTTEQDLQGQICKIKLIMLHWQGERNGMRTVWSRELHHRGHGGTQSLCAPLVSSVVRLYFAGVLAFTW
jgi:hypothetical protein